MYVVHSSLARKCPMASSRNYAEQNYNVESAIFMLLQILNKDQGARFASI